MDFRPTHKLISTGVAITALVLSVLLLGAGSRLKALQEEKEMASRQLREEEAVVIAPAPGETEPTVLPVEPLLFEYIQITEGCGPYFEGDCLRARSGPGLDYPIVARLRNGMVLKVGGKVERDGMTWYKILFDEWLRYPERLGGDWYVSADYVRALFNEGPKNLEIPEVTTTKRIIVDRSEQKLYAYDGEVLVMEAVISTGLELTPTPRGTFTIYRKTPNRYMQGPLPGISAKYWDLPGVPWNLYFSAEGAVIHGTYWHNNFGKPSSNGCVNVRPEEAERLYMWADLGTTVVVRD